MAGVSFKHITKIFGSNVKAVNDLNLDIQDGEFMVLVGPSGCGKTTALRMIAGLEETTEGELYIGEKVVNDVPPKDRDIAMVFQNYALYPHMTVYENIAFGVKLREMKSFFWEITHFGEADKIRKDIDGRVKEVAKMLNIDHLLDRQPKQLSGGQRQRVALARAIVRKPKVFLMDEPLSNLDAKLRIQTRAELIRLHRDLKITTIYVTHDQVEAMTMGNRVAIMSDGILQQCDTPQNVYEKPANKFVAGFIGSPPINFLDGTVSPSGSGFVVKTTLAEIPLPADHPAAVAGKALTVGVRPEGIVVGGEFAKFSAKVDVLEHLGHEYVGYLQIGETHITSTIDTDAGVKEGQTVEFGLRLQDIHFFDPESGVAIR